MFDSSDAFKLPDVKSISCRRMMPAASASPGLMFLVEVFFDRAKKIIELIFSHHPSLGLSVDSKQHVYVRFWPHFTNGSLKN